MMRFEGALRRVAAARAFAAPEGLRQALKQVQQLLERVEAKLDAADGRVRYTMNGYVIAVGCWVASLRTRALQTARALGKVEVDFGETYCTVPDATAYITKLAARPPKKRKTARC